LADIKQISLTEEKNQEQLGYEPGTREQEVVSSFITKFRNSKADRDRNFEYFDGENLIDYINDSVRRFVTNVDEREDIEDWQARIHDPFTRNKVLAILAKVVRVLPVAEFMARGDEDNRKAQLLSNLYEYSEDIDDYDELMLYVLLEAIVKGTAIAYEGMERNTKKIRNVEGVNDEITVKEATLTKNKPFGAIVPLEDFYPSSVSIRNIKMMPYCFWRSVMTFDEFRMNWSMFPQFRNVQPFTNYGEENVPFWNTMIGANIKEGQVEVIRYYNKLDDEYVIIANGVWLNPMKNGIIQPLPFNHKELPFWDIKFELFGADFFYGKSLPDKLKSLQDVLNVLENMLLDQSFLTIFPPLLTSGFDSIEDDYLRPGRRTPVDTQGEPLGNSFMKLDLGTPNGWHQYILEYTRSVMEQASMDSVSQGVAGQGDRTTAQEVRIAADAVAATLGLFGKLVNYGVKRKAQLRGANILQFWTDPLSPVEQIMGEGANKQFNEAFNTFKINNTVLTSGKRGTKIIEMYADTSKMPDKAQLKARATIANADKTKKIEIMAVDPSYIRDFTFDTKLVPNQKRETTKDLEKALQLEKVRIYKTFWPNLINDPELAAETAEKMGDDPTKIFLAEPMGWAPADENNPEKAKTLGTEPKDPAAQNTVRGAQGGEQGANGMRDLMNSMLG
jgi:hypothetical protein